MACNRQDLEVHQLLEGASCFLEDYWAGLMLRDWRGAFCGERHPIPETHDAAASFSRIRLVLSLAQSHKTDRANANEIYLFDAL